MSRHNLSHHLRTVSQSRIAVTADNETLVCARLKDMMDMPISHYMGPVGYALTEAYGFDHPAMTLGMLIAQAVAEASEYERHQTGRDYAQPISFTLTGDLLNLSPAAID